MVYENLQDMFIKAKYYLEHEEERPLVTVTYFQPDAKKDGGRYMTYTGNFRFYDAEKRVMKFVDGMVIGVGQVCRIEIK